VEDFLDSYFLGIQSCLSQRLFKHLRRLNLVPMNSRLRSERKRFNDPNMEPRSEEFKDNRREGKIS
jgi:hypothetical protein